MKDRIVISSEELEADRAARVRRYHLRRILTLGGLLSPPILLLVFPFLLSLILLFTYSAYRFTGMHIERVITFEAYQKFFSDSFYWDIIKRSLRLAATVTFFTLIIGYPTAYAISRVKSDKLKIFLFVLIFSPLLTSVVTRAFGWMILLGNSGFVNYVLEQLGLIDSPIRLIYDYPGVIVSMVHIQLPFTVFPILSVMNQIDPVLKEAACDLGANKWNTFSRVTWPLTFPGLIAGAQICFVLAISAYVAPSLLGGGRVLVLPRLIYGGITTLNWPLAAVESIVLISIALLIVFLSNLLLQFVYMPPRG